MDKLEKLLERISNFLKLIIDIFFGMVLVFFCLCVGFYFVSVQGVKDLWRFLRLKVL